MALSSGNKVEWSDVQALYAKLNVQRQRLSMNQVAVPAEQGNQTLTTHVSDLKTLIEALSANQYIGSRASTGVTVPSRTDKLEPAVYTRMDTTLDTIASTCLFDGTNFGFVCPYDGTNFGFRGTNFVVFSTNFSGDGTNFGFRGTNNSWDGWVCPYNSTNFSGNGTNFSGNGTNFSGDGTNFSAFATNFSGNGTNFSGNGTNFSNNGTNNGFFFTTVNFGFSPRGSNTGWSCWCFASGRFFT